MHTENMREKDSQGQTEQVFDPYREILEYVIDSTIDDKVPSEVILYSCQNQAYQFCDQKELFRCYLGFLAMVLGQQVVKLIIQAYYHWAIHHQS